MHATMAATARPCTRAGWSLPVSPSFSMTDTQPMNTKNMVPSSSARHGWNTLSNWLGLAGGIALTSGRTRDAPASPISIFSSAMSLRSGLGGRGRGALSSCTHRMFVAANGSDFVAQPGGEELTKSRSISRRPSYSRIELHHRAV